MKKLQKGFITPVLLILLALLVIGGGIYIYKNKKTETAVDTKQNFSNSINLKSFNSSALPHQDDFFEFKYPDNWEVYTRDADRVYLAKEKGLLPDKFYEDVISKQKNYIEINMSGDNDTLETIKRIFNPSSISARKINGTDAIFFTWKGFENPKDNITSYNLTSQYVNKNSITISLNSHSSQPSSSDIKDMEKIVETFKIIETEKGTMERKSQYVVPPVPQ